MNTKQLTSARPLVGWKGVRNEFYTPTFSSFDTSLPEGGGEYWGVEDPKGRCSNQYLGRSGCIRCCKQLCPGAFVETAEETRTLTMHLSSLQRRFNAEAELW